MEPGPLHNRAFPTEEGNMDIGHLAAPHSGNRHFVQKAVPPVGVSCCLLCPQGPSGHTPVLACPAQGHLGAVIQQCTHALCLPLLTEDAAFWGLQGACDTEPIPKGDMPDCSSGRAGLTALWQGSKSPRSLGSASREKEHIQRRVVLSAFGEIHIRTHIFQVLLPLIFLMTWPWFQQHCIAG